MAIELGHEGLAKPHHFAVCLARGIEVSAAFAATHGQAGERVLESLLESQKLQDRLVDRGMEAKPPFVGADGVVVLHAIAAIYPDIAFLVFPADSERDHAVRFRHALKHL